VNTRALYLHFEGGMDGAVFASLVDRAEQLGYRVIDEGAYILLRRVDGQEQLKRMPFPGTNPQEIRCPIVNCGGSARTSDDGVVYLCEHGHHGYYEHPLGTLLPEGAWRLSPAS
jgi:hypothetical protein